MDSETPIIFDFSDYVSYVRALADAKGSRSGFKSAMAEQAGCNLTYISNVLAGRAHLSLEHAEKLNALLAHTPEEARFFLLLVQKDRAGTISLREYFERDIREMLKRRLSIRDRLGFRSELDPEDRNRYYSAWYFAAIHVALSIPNLQTASALAHYFRLPLATVASTLHFLTETGLAKAHGRRFEIGPTIIHLPSDAEQIQMHHTNWRTQALGHLVNERPEELHYSAAVTIAKEDARMIKDALLKSLEKVTKLIRQSREEEVFVLNLDFFQLGAGE